MGRTPRPERARIVAALIYENVTPKELAARLGYQVANVCRVAWANGLRRMYVTPHEREQLIAQRKHEQLKSA